MSDTSSPRRGWFGRKRVEDRALTVTSVPPALLSTTSSGATVTPANALAIADAWACIRALSDAASSLPLIAYRSAATGRQRVSDGVLPELLRRPAPATTQANLIGQAMAHLQLHGNAFIGKFRGDGVVEQLALLAPDRVTVELRGGMPFYAFRDGVGRETILGPGDVIHVRGMSTDGVVGLSPVAQAREALGLSARLTEHAARFFANDARPSGILSVPAGPGVQDSIDNLKLAWEARHGGTANAHRIAVLSGEVAFNPVSMPLEDAQFLEQRKLSATEIARVFRVPPWIIGADAGSSMTYANVEQQALAFVTYSLRPWLVVIEQAISADDDLCPGDLYVEFLLDALLRGDSKTRSEVYAAALDPLTGWMTRDEVRRLENLAPEPPTLRPTPEELLNAA